MSRGKYVFGLARAYSFWLICQYELQQESGLYECELYYIYHRHGVPGPVAYDVDVTQLCATRTPRS